MVWDGYVIIYLSVLIFWSTVAHVFFGWYEGRKDEPLWYAMTVFWPVTVAFLVPGALFIVYCAFLSYLREQYVKYRKKVEWDKKNAAALRANLGRGNHV